MRTLSGSDRCEYALEMQSPRVDAQRVLLTDAALAFPLRALTTAFQQEPDA